MAVTLADFVARFPQFDGQDELIEALLVECAYEVGTDWDQAEQDLALKYLVAHRLVEEGRADEPAITSESIGGISVSYASPGPDNLESTAYGRQYKAIRRRNSGGPIVIL